MFLLLISEPTAVDSSGGDTPTRRSTGVAYCSRADRMACVVRDSQFFVPLQTSTEIGPDQSATFTIALRASPPNSQGDKITLAERIAYRIVKEANRDKDASMPQAQKLKTLRFGSTSFNGPRKPRVRREQNHLRGTAKSSAAIPRPLLSHSRRPPCRETRRPVPQTCPTAAKPALGPMRRRHE